MTSAMDAEVVIVGGGPVGMGTAIELGQRGVKCILVERYPSPQPIPKGQNLTQRTMEHFHFWGAEPQLRAARTIPREYGIGGLTAYGTLLGPHTYDWLQRELVRPYYFVDNERLPQYATEAVMRERLAQIDCVQTLYGWSMESLEQDDADVGVHIAERNGSGRRTLRARFVIGCDGSRSRVRQQAGIPQVTTTHDRTMVLIVFRSTELHTLLEKYPGKSYYNVLQPELKGYWKFFGRVDLGTTWFFHAPVPSDTTAANFDFKAYLQEAVGASFDIDIEHIGFWDLRFAVAERYRASRVFIAGDAAHSHPPYGGYGVNSGLEDARNIGWKLAAYLQGWGGEPLLDSYDAERRPVFESTARDFIAHSIETDRDFLEHFNPDTDRTAFEQAWNARASGAVGEVNAFEPNYEGSPVVLRSGTGQRVSSAKGNHSFEARPGHHLSPSLLTSGSNVYEHLGPGFTLLAFGDCAASLQSFVNAAVEMRIALEVVRDEPDSNGAAKRYGSQLVLVRPDHFVAYCSSDRSLELSTAMQVLERASGK